MIELNRSRNNVVLSRRAVLEEERKEVRQQILDRLQPGLVVEGQISNIVDFGAFVDLDGIDGLIHISELSWSHVNHPSEILNIGDTVQVKVLDIDRDRQRISLGLKQTQEDPWQRIVDTYNVNDELAGKVTKVVTFGAFVEVLDGVEGLVHISELAGHHVESPREIVHPGDEIRVKILEIDSERRRLSLSAKRVEDQILPLPRPDAPAASPAEPEAVADEQVVLEDSLDVAVGEDAGELAPIGSRPSRPPSRLRLAGRQSPSPSPRQSLTRRLRMPQPRSRSLPLRRSWRSPRPRSRRTSLLRRSLRRRSLLLRLRWRSPRRGRGRRGCCGGAGCRAAGRRGACRGGCRRGAGRRGRRRAACRRASPRLTGSSRAAGGAVRRADRRHGRR